MSAHKLDLASRVMSNHCFSFFSFRPAYATHALLACYVFLPITKNSHAFVLGLTATMCYLTTLLLITYSNTSNCVAKVNLSSITNDTTAAVLIANKYSKGNWYPFFSFSIIADHHRHDILRVRERTGALLQVHERGRYQAFLLRPSKVRRVHAQTQLWEGSGSRFLNKQ